MKASVKKQILRFLQERINKKNRSRLAPCSEARSIIANNCIGGFISHYLKLRFASPTVNLFVLPGDYIKMLREFDKYVDPNAPITQAETDKDYPVGEIYGCKIWFMHYKDFDSAVEKWRKDAPVSIKTLCTL